jgi:hypothetical protein
MSKANFYRIPVKPKPSDEPRRRQAAPPMPAANDEEHHASVVAPRMRPTYHAAPQFRRNRRFWMRRIEKQPR